MSANLTMTDLFCGAYGVCESSPDAMQVLAQRLARRDAANPTARQIAADLIADQRRAGHNRNAYRVTAWRVFHEASALAYAECEAASWAPFFDDNARATGRLYFAVCLLLDARAARVRVLEQARAREQSLALRHGRSTVAPTTTGEHTR